MKNVWQVSARKGFVDFFATAWGRDKDEAEFNFRANHPTASIYRIIPS